MSLIIKARNIRLDYAGRDVLDIDELEIHSYDRIGLVGDNGAGKSSLPEGSPQIAPPYYPHSIRSSGVQHH